MLAEIVDGGALVKVLWASTAAGLGVTFAFSVTIVGATRAIDLRRDGHNGWAVLYGLLGALGAAAVAAGVVLGIIIMSAK